MRWTQAAAQTYVQLADGEVVWSGRPMQAAKVRNFPRTTVATKLWSPRRAAKETVKTTVRECRLLRCTLGC